MKTNFYRSHNDNHWTGEFFVDINGKFELTKLVPGGAQFWLKSRGRSWAWLFTASRAFFIFGFWFGITSIKVREKSFCESAKQTNPQKKSTTDICSICSPEKQTASTEPQFVNCQSHILETKAKVLKETLVIHKRENTWPLLHSCIPLHLTWPL